MEEEHGDYYLYSLEVSTQDNDKKYIGMFASFDGKKIDFTITNENKIKLSKVSNDENGHTIYMTMTKYEKGLFKQRIRDILNAAEVQYCLKKPCSTQVQN